MQYGQGMVRPGCWWKPDGFAPGYIDRQYQIAKSEEAYLYDIASVWSTLAINAAEQKFRMAALFRNTTAENEMAWQSCGYSTAAMSEMVWAPTFEVIVPFKGKAPQHA